MSTKLEFSVRIQATRPHVWRVMLDDPTYRVWTRPFCAGSYYEGSWDEGARIRFLSPEGGGMVAQIAANRLHEFISIRHLGIIQDGVEDTDSAAVKAWGPAFENYRFRDVDGATEVSVECDTSPEFEDYLRDAWPKALAALRELCEAGPDAV